MAKEIFIVTIDSFVSNAQSSDSDHGSIAKQAVATRPIAPAFKVCMTACLLTAPPPCGIVKASVRRWSSPQPSLKGLMTPGRRRAIRSFFVELAGVRKGDRVCGSSS